jgi:uncharacterized protein DUF3800
MHFFIDESGIFLVTGNNTPKISSITALTIPDRHIDRLSKKFIELRRNWGYDCEVKGSRLSERQISETISLLRTHDVLLDITCIDTGLHTEEDISAYKKVSGENLVKHLTPQHHENLVRQINEYRERLLALSNQLFVQSVLTIDLVPHVLNISTLYYCQRMPQELGNFVWYIDAKGADGEQTPFEQLWSTLLMPVIETNYRMDEFEGGDYSHFDKFRIPEEELTEHQKSLMTEKSSGAVLLNKIIKDTLHFADSGTHIGLQLVDIMASAFNRAMNGTLQFDGWKHLGALTIKQPRIVTLGGAKKVVEEKRHRSVLNQMKSIKKSMLVVKNR